MRITTTGRIITTRPDACSSLRGGGKADEAIATVAHKSMRDAIASLRYALLAMTRGY